MLNIDDERLWKYLREKRAEARAHQGGYGKLYGLGKEHAIADMVLFLGLSEEED